MFIFKKQQDDTIPNVETNLEQVTIETDARPANFYFFVETEEGNAFANNLLIEQYLLSNKILKDVSEQKDLERH